MKKILCLIDSLGAGGAQRQLIGLASFLREKGLDVTVAFYHDEPFYADQSIRNDVPYVYLKGAERKAARLFQIARFIRKSNPDVVISFLDTPNICACFARFFNRSFRLITSERNTTQITGIKEIIRFNLFRLAQNVVPNAYSQADYITRRFPFLSKKLVVIPNYVDLTHFTPLPERTRHSVCEIIVVATIWPSKNTLGFIDAVKRLIERGCKFHISWYGKDESNLDYFNRSQQKINQLEVGNWIELKAKTSNIVERYQDADFFCLPSFYEGTPNVICEALACGLPVACSDVCDNSRYVRDGENGFLFNPSDTESIADALEKMITLGDDSYQEYCQSSRSVAEQMLAKERFVNSFMELIEQ